MSQISAVWGACGGSDGRAPVVRAHPHTSPRAAPGFGRAHRETAASDRHPLGHLVHAVSPSSSAYEPSTHAEHCDDPCAMDTVPFAHLVHDPEPCSATYPFSHFAQVLVPSTSCEPAAQGLHSVRASFVTKPGPQNVQFVVPPVE